MTPSIIDWRSNGGVHYNRLKLVFNSGNGNVRIIQREVANKAGSGVSSTVGDVGATDYVIDKNEYYIAVGELAVQPYPYTWDFSSYNLGANHSGTSGKSSTVEAIEKATTSTSYGYWSKHYAPYTSATKASVPMGTNASNDPTQVLNIDKPLFAESADLKAANPTDGVTTLIEGKGLGFSLPSQQKQVTISGTTYYYDGYNTTGSFGMNGAGVTGVGSITIPDVDAGMYIFVQASAEPSDVTGATTPASDPFSVKNGVYLYQTSGSDPQDVVISFDAATQVNMVGVTNLVKTINVLGYATESRNHAIDHTYQGKFTNHDVNAYAITRYDPSSDTYQYRGYPQVTKSAAVSVVPANTGIVLYKANHSGDSFSSPLFYPAVNITPTSDDVAILANNWMAPNVESKQHYSETIQKSAAMGTAFSYDPWCTKFIMTRTYYTYFSTTGTSSAAQESPVEAFYRMRIDTNAATAAQHNTIDANKAYLLIPNDDVPEALWAGSASSRSGMIFIDLNEGEGDNGEQTAIESPMTTFEADNEADYYSLSGIRLSGKPTKSGMYVRNGKKLIVK